MDIVNFGGVYICVCFSFWGFFVCVWCRLVVRSLVLPSRLLVGGKLVIKKSDDIELTVTTYTTDSDYGVRVI